MWPPEPIFHCKCYEEDNKAMVRIHELKKQVSEGKRKLHNAELCNFYPSLNIIRVIKLKRNGHHVMKTYGGVEV
jgi:hypothetical protein